MKRIIAYFNLHSRKLFRGGVFLKISTAFFELFLGGVFLLLNRADISYFLTRLTGFDDVGPLDVAARSVVHDVFIYSNAFWAFLFISHGAIKIVLSYGLLKDKLWAFIASLIVFSYFIANQIFRLAQNPSYVLELITLLDVLVVFLIYAEFRKMKRGGASHMH